eukprot:629835-Amphidinium_carterae.1
MTRKTFCQECLSAKADLRTHVAAEVKVLLHLAHSDRRSIADVQEALAIVGSTKEGGGAIMVALQGTGGIVLLEHARVCLAKREQE